MLVSYGKMEMLGWFSHDETSIPCTKSKVVIKTDRGLEIGKLVGRYSYKGGNLKINCDDLHEYYDRQSDEYPIGKGGTFVRFATAEDLSEERHINESAQEELQVCLRIVKELGLEMKIVDFEHIFGGERIIFYFLSDGRVDFRELVKRLAKEFQTRIEMRQIGARDEARIISDYETCGQQCCCSRYLKILKPVNMRMAKIQKATLDPSKISGHCGRLRCCLRFEDETYKQLKANLPNRATRVKTEHGEGKVVDYQILTQLVKVLYDDGKFEAVALEDIEILKDQRSPQQKKQQEIKNSNNDVSTSKDNNKVAGETAAKEQSPEEQRDASTDKSQEQRPNSQRTSRNNRRRKPRPQNTQKRAENKPQGDGQKQKGQNNPARKKRRRRPNKKNAMTKTQNNQGNNSTKKED